MPAAQRPVYPKAPTSYDPRVLQQILLLLAQRDNATPVSPASTGWDVSNYTTRRALTATSSQAEIADFVCTLVADLKATGALA